MPRQQAEINQQMERWVAGAVVDLEPFLKKFGLLTTDIVVEGGRGNYTGLAHVMLRLMASALYVATDLEPSIAGRSLVTADNINARYPSLKKQSDEPTESMARSLLYADCFDLPLIEELVRLRGSSPSVMLVSMDALYALRNARANQSTKKRPEHQHDLKTILNRKLYTVHLHLSVDAWDTEFANPQVYRTFSDMEQGAIAHGWSPHRLVGNNLDALLLIPKT